MGGLSNTTMMSRVGGAPSRKKFLHALLTDHPVAKLMAIALSTLFVVMIHRELPEDLYDDWVQVVVAGQDAAPVSDVLEVRAEGNFHLRTPNGAVARTRLKVRGIVRQGRQVSDPLRATAQIPPTRLAGLTKRDPWGVFELEPGDIRIIDAPGGLEISCYPPVRIEAELIDERDVPLSAALRDPEFKAVFEKETVRLRGPVRKLAEKKEVLVEVPDRVGVHQITALPKGFAEDGIQLAPKVAILVNVTRKDRGTEGRLAVKARLRFALPYENPRFDVELNDPLKSDPRISVYLVGPKARVESLERNADAQVEIARSVFVVVPVGEIAEGLRSELTEPGSKREVERVWAWVHLAADVAEKYGGLRPEATTVDVGQPMTIVRLADR
jgi:hypothetical protein